MRVSISPIGARSSKPGLATARRATPAARVGRARRVPAVSAAAVQSAVATKDEWLSSTLQALEQSADGASAPLAEMKGAANDKLLRSSVPTTRDEEYRFTDLAKLLSSKMCAPAAGGVDTSKLDAMAFSEASGSRLAIIDGKLDLSASNLSSIPSNVYVGNLADAPDWAVSKLNKQASSSRGNVFSTFNSATATDVAVVAVPAGVKMECPLHIMTLASSAPNEGELSASAQRLLVCLGEDAAVEVVEEFQTTQGSGGAFTTSVAEIYLDEGAALKHGVLQLSDSGSGVHMKTTLVQQATNSCYKVVESCLGGNITRHDLNIVQLGPDTNTTMRHFLLAGKDQLHDLHSKLILDHPRGVADQLHKCIAVSPTSRGVFDGNVKVNRAAQQTDAGQLSRNLLLAPRATVNVKPNLQIVADDVKCTHGCTVSDLSEEELFYFASRGIDKETARSCLVYSFGAEVLREHGFEGLSSRLQAEMTSMLAAV
eukprot:jgi/Tetstr1/438113/TSEL_026736.t1